MKAVAVYPGKKDSAHIRDVPAPEPGPGEVLVKLIRIGLDGTDSEINSALYGWAPKGEDYLILGHETFGRVQAVGKGVNGLKPGEGVVATVRRDCHWNCINCENDENDNCLTGDYMERGIKERHGMLAEFYVDDPRFIVPIPEEHAEVAVLLEPLTIAEKGVFQTFEAQKRMAWEPKTALVLGVGPLGVLCAMVLRDMEIETFAVGRGPLDPVRRTFLETMGVNYITTGETPLVEIPKKLGHQLDFVIEATGSSQVAFDAMQVIGINGALCLMGVSPGNKMLQVPTDVINLEMVLGNKLILGSVNANRKYFEMGVKRFARFEKRWPGLLNRFITKRVGMDGFMEGIAKDRSQLKVVVEVGD